jgi:uncharacterized membrane protein YphA (DoxX/SURF4 family)
MLTLSPSLVDSARAVPTPHPRSRAAALPRVLATLARLLLGLTFFVCGLNGFLNFLPAPSTGMPPAAVAFGSALFSTGYMLPLIAGTELFTGALLLANCFVPLALIVLAPVVVNIVLFHAFLTPPDVLVACLVLVLEVGLALAHRRSYAALFVLRPQRAAR